MLKNQVKDVSFLIRAGMAGLATYHLLRWFLHPTTSFWEGALDGATGVLFGISAGLLLYAAWLNGRQRRGEGPAKC